LKTSKEYRLICKELDEKKTELIVVKKLHKKLAGEFIDLWVKLKRLEKTN
jgi:hypothetical protein